LQIQAKGKTALAQPTQSPQAISESPSDPIVSKADLVKKIMNQWPLEVKENVDGQFSFVDDPSLSDLMLKLDRTIGTANPSLGLGLINQVLASSRIGGKYTSEAHNRTIAAIHAIKPKNGLEGMLAAQMVTMHNLAMDFSARAMKPDLASELIDRNVERANRCFRTFATQVEALNRLRGNSQQKVVVEHVTVNKGGQAVVGSVNQNINPGGQGQV
jgi:hypothetical protein